MNIILLMAGSSDAFAEAGFVYPKNLIEIAGKPMVQHVMENFASLKTFDKTKFICLVQETECRHFYTSKIIQLIDEAAKVIPVPEKTSGAACTSLLAIGEIDHDQPLIIVNGDILVLEELNKIIESFRARDLDGGVVVFDSVHPRWSYVKCDEEGYVVEASEKRPISRLATAGVYYYKTSRDYLESAMDMIRKDAHVNNAFYVCPVFNEMILKQKKIGVHHIQKERYVSFASLQGIKEYELRLERCQAE